MKIIDRIATIKDRIVTFVKAHKKPVIITASLLCGCIIFIIVLSSVIIPSAKYNSALKLYNDGKYLEAANEFEKIDYKDSKNKFFQCKYDYAMLLYSNNRYEEAAEEFESLGSYKDSRAKAGECNSVIALEEKYNTALSQIKSGNIIEAYPNLISLKGYKDSAKRAEEIYEQYKVEKIKSAKVGDIVVFGSYEQDDDLSNGKEEIRWIVLAKDKDSAFLISCYLLDCEQYNTSKGNVTWETCTLRKWLNETFFGEAFDSKEQTRIKTTHVSTEKNSEFGTDSGNDTYDKVFLLSANEVLKYLRSKRLRSCEFTRYAYGNGGGVTKLWWLRTCGNYQKWVACVDSSISYLGIEATCVDIGVRPALWVDLSV